MIFWRYINIYAFADSNQPPDTSGCYSGKDFIPDAKIRFKFNILEVNNIMHGIITTAAVIWKKKYFGFSPTENWYLKNLDDSISNAGDIPKV